MEALVTLQEQKADSSRQSFLGGLMLVGCNTAQPALWNVCCPLLSIMNTDTLFCAFLSMSGTDQSVLFILL